MTTQVKGQKKDASDWLHEKADTFRKISIFDLDDLNFHFGGKFAVTEIFGCGLIYKRDGMGPSTEDFLEPLDEECFNADGSFNDEQVMNYLSKYATLLSIKKILYYI
jgi:hypothetical protein